MNWHTVLSQGSGTSEFDKSQLGSVDPENIGFESGDLINFGADHAKRVTVDLVVTF